MRYRNPTRFSAAALIAAMATAGLGAPAVAQEAEQQEEAERSEEAERDRDRERHRHHDRERIRERVRVAPRVTVRMPQGAFFFGQRGRLGISISGSQDDAEFAGARVESVVEDGPADKADIREGDVITSLDGQSLFEPLEDNAMEQRLDLDTSVPVQRLLAIVHDLEPGETVEVTLERDGQEITTDVVTEDVSPRMAMFDGVRIDPDDFDWDGAFDFDADELRERIETQIRPQIERMRHWAPRVSDAPLSWLGGITLAPMNPSLGEYFETDSGVLVLEADEDTSLNLRAGDVLLSIDGRDVQDSDDARRILSSYNNGETMDLRIMRKGQEMTIQGEMQ